MARPLKAVPTEKAPPLTMQQRLFIVALFLFALAVSVVVVRYVDPIASTRSWLARPVLIVAANTGAIAS